MRHGVRAFVFGVIGAVAACSSPPEADIDEGDDLPQIGETFASECYQCHGNSLSPAPPRAVGGETDRTYMGVGAHRSHLGLESTWHRPVACSSCHLVPDEVESPGHMDDGDDKAELNFGNYAVAGGVSPRFTGATCQNAYCHGATLSGGSLNEPTWNLLDGTQKACGTCHGYPPPAPHPVGTSCGSCHPTMQPGADIFLDPNSHINGKVDLADGSGGACDSCHGSGGISAPPNDLQGNTDRVFQGVGAHRQHLASSTWRREINCSNCHVVPAEFGDPAHLDGDDIAEVPFDAFNPAAQFDRGAGACSNLYCHGNGRGSNGTTIWTNTEPMQCNSCHIFPAVGQNAKVMSGEHDKHIRDKRVPCDDCHAQVINANRTIIDATLHINARNDILMPRGGNYDPATKRCTNMACHENETW